MNKSIGVFSMLTSCPAITPFRVQLLLVSMAHYFLLSLSPQSPRPSDSMSPVPLEATPLPPSMPSPVPEVPKENGLNVCSKDMEDNSLINTCELEGKAAVPPFTPSDVPSPPLPGVEALVSLMQQPNCNLKVIPVKMASVNTVKAEVIPVQGKNLSLPENCIPVQVRPPSLQMVVKEAKKIQADNEGPVGNSLKDSRY